MDQVKIKKPLVIIQTYQVRYLLRAIVTLKILLQFNAEKKLT